MSKKLEVMSQSGVVLGLCAGEYWELTNKINNAYNNSIGINTSVSQALGSLETRLNTNISIVANNLAYEAEQRGTSISNLQQILEEADNALAQSISTNVATLNNNISAVEDITTALADENSAFATSISSLVSLTDGHTTNISSINTSLTTLTDENIARASEIVSLGSTVDDDRANVETLLETYVDGDEIKSTRFESLESRTSGAEANITNISQTTISTTDTLSNMLNDNLIAKALKDGQITLYTSTPIGNIKAYDLWRIPHADVPLGESANSSDPTKNYASTDDGYFYKYYNPLNNSWDWCTGNQVRLFLSVLEVQDAQSLADGKVNVFYDTPPAPPYDVGDLWINSDKEVYRCNVARSNAESFNISDWTVATRYSADIQSVRSETLNVIDNLSYELSNQVDVTYTEYALAIANIDGRITPIESNYITETIAQGLAEAEATQKKIEAQAYADGIITVEENARILQGENLITAYKNYGDILAKALDDGVLTQAEIDELGEAKAKIDNYRTSINSKIDTITTNINELQSLDIALNLANLDGKIDQEEQNRINAITQEQTDRLIALQDEANARGIDISDVTNAYKEYIRLINTAIADGVLTPEEQAQISEAWQSVEDIKNNIDTKIETASNLIKAQAGTFTEVNYGGSTLISGWQSISAFEDGDEQNDFTIFTENFKVVTGFSEQDITRDANGKIISISSGSLVSPFSISGNSIKFNGIVEFSNVSGTEDLATITDVNTAENNANSYTDTAKSEAISSAEAYAQAQILAEQTRADAYADGIVSAEEARAIADAQDKADIAEANAKYYADTNFVTQLLYSTDIVNLQNQIDNNITAWFGNGEPTLSNYPANEWTTTELKNQHIGDSYTDDDTNYSYRFKFVNSNFVWERISDSDITLALNLANEAKDTADGKRRIFINTPIPPYDEGDQWADGTDILHCTNAKAIGGSYSITDWEKINGYTDDTRAIEAEDSAKAYAQAQANLAQTTAQAHADGIVTLEEQARILDAQNKLAEAKAYADTKKSEALAYTDSTSVTYLDIANSYADNLANAKQDAIVNGKTIINGGYLNTELIQSHLVVSDDILANRTISAPTISGGTITGVTVQASTFVGQKFKYDDNLILLTKHDKDTKTRWSNTINNFFETYWVSRLEGQLQTYSNEYIIPLGVYSSNDTTSTNKQRAINETGDCDIEVSGNNTILTLTDGTGGIGGIYYTVGDYDFVFQIRQGETILFEHTQTISGLGDLSSISADVFGINFSFESFGGYKGFPIENPWQSRTHDLTISADGFAPFLIGLGDGEANIRIYIELHDQYPNLHGRRISLNVNKTILKYYNF
jgi:tellurite resistance protein